MRKLKGYLIPIPYTDENGAECFKEGKMTKKSSWHLTAKNASKLVKCFECRKLRILYSEKKLKIDDQSKLQRVLKKHIYISGTSFDVSIIYDDVHPNCLFLFLSIPMYRWKRRRIPQKFTLYIYIFLMHLICHTDVLLSCLASYKPFPGIVNITLHKHCIFFYSRKFIKKYLSAAEYQ